MLRRKQLKQAPAHPRRNQIMPASGNRLANICCGSGKKL
jgi:hypothetical protein